MGLDTKDPLFLIWFGLSFIWWPWSEQAPENWRALFDEFEQELGHMDDAKSQDAGGDQSAESVGRPADGKLSSAIQN